MDADGGEFAEPEPAPVRKAAKPAPVMDDEEFF
jgi:hypothetical protein